MTSMPAVSNGYREDTIIEKDRGTESPNVGFVPWVVYFEFVILRTYMPVGGESSTLVIRHAT